MKATFLGLPLRGVVRIGGIFLAFAGLPLLVHARILAPWDAAGLHFIAIRKEP